MYQHGYYGKVIILYTNVKVKPYEKSDNEKKVVLRF